MSKHELEGKFNPKDFEDEIYENWEKKGYFKPSNDKSKNAKVQKQIEIC